MPLRLFIDRNYVLYYIQYFPFDNGLSVQYIIIKTNIYLSKFDFILLGFMEVLMVFKDSITMSFYIVLVKVS